VIVASRRDLFYAQFFGGNRPKGPVQLVRESELIERLRAEEREMTLVGSGAERIAASLEGHPKLRAAPAGSDRASALWIAKLGWSEKPADQLYEIEPLYVEPLLA